MGGAFQTSREIFSNPIWQNIVQFRLFFLIYGNAAFIDGVKIGDIELKRGQWVRSYRNLQKDLEYIENHCVKQYAISTIKNALFILRDKKRINFEHSELGTLFTVINYDTYQEFSNYITDTWHNEKTEKKHSSNTDETIIRKVKKEKNIYTSNSFLEIQEKFNCTVTKLPQIKSISQKRETALKALLKLYTQDQIFEVFEKTQNSDFLTGVKTEWKASFDWIINQNNFLKILEGNYENKNTQKEKPLQVKAEIEIIPR